MELYHTRVWNQKMGVTISTTFTTHGALARMGSFAEQGVIFRARPAAVFMPACGLGIAGRLLAAG